MKLATSTVYVWLFSAAIVVFSQATLSAELNILFLGDKGHHRPKDLFAQLQPVLAKRGVDLTYTDDVNEVNPVKLREYDVLLLGR